MRQAGGRKRRTAWFLALALVIGTLTGCGGKEGAGASGSQEGGAAADGGAAQAEQGVAMGRYVEKDVDLNGNALTDWNSRVFPMADGSLLLEDNSGFVLRSQDNGCSWTKEELPWLTQMEEEDNAYIRCMAFAPDQTAAVLWTQPLEESSGDGVQLDLNMKVTIVKPDGTLIQANLSDAQAQMIDSVYISDTGQIFVTGFSETIYEVQGDGSFAEYLAVEDGWPTLLRFQGNLMLLDGIGFTSPLLYDMEAKKYIEDDVLADFVKENFGDRDSSAGRNYDLFLLPGDDNSIYLAGGKGVYRHVLGGSAIEQVIDGSLTTLGNPAYTIMDMAALADNEFLVLFTQGKVLRFVYDPDIPARPDEKLRVWSLEEKPTIRQAVNVFQKENPAVYVDYEIGLAPGSSMTRDDVIKNLNTEIMAGAGPDVLVLDDMPMDSYIEKGILADISPILSSFSGDEAVFPNVAEAFQKEDKVYTIPCELQLPYLFGRSSDLDKMTNVSEIADVMETLRQEKAEADLLRLPSAKGIMRLFSMASAPAWRTENGGLDAEAVRDYLMQTKRIYDAEMEGISEEALQEWRSEAAVYQEYESENGEAYEDSDKLRMNSRSCMYFMADLQQLMAGSLDKMDAYHYLTSIMAVEGYEGCEALPMSGQGGKVFWARTLLGINAASAQMDMAEAFIKAALGGEVQKDVQDGIPVTRQAVLSHYEDQWRIYKDNDYVSGMGSIYSEEKGEIDLHIRIPDEAQVNELLNWITSMNTPYLEDKTFEQVVYEEGETYLRGERSIEETMESIETRLGIYLAE